MTPPPPPPINIERDIDEIWLALETTKAFLRREGYVLPVNDPAGNMGNYLLYLVDRALILYPRRFTQNRPSSNPPT